MIKKKMNWDKVSKQNQKNRRDKELFKNHSKIKDINKPISVSLIKGLNIRAIYNQAVTKSSELNSQQLNQLERIKRYLTKKKMILEQKVI